LIKTLESLKAMFGQAEYLLLNSSQTDTRSTIAAEAAALNVAMPILDDETQAVAKSLGVTQTGEAFVIDPIGWKIVYHGPINAAAAKDPDTQFLLFNAMVYFLYIARLMKRMSPRRARLSRCWRPKSLPPRAELPRSPPTIGKLASGLPARRQQLPPGRVERRHALPP